MTDGVRIAIDFCQGLTIAEKRDLAGRLTQEAQAAEDAIRVNQPSLREYLLRLNGRRISFEMIWRQVQRERSPKPSSQELLAEITKLDGEKLWRAIPMAWDEDGNAYTAADIGEEGDEFGKFFLHGNEVADDDIMYFYDTTGGR